MKHTIIIALVCTFIVNTSYAAHEALENIRHVHEKRLKNADDTIAACRKDLSLKKIPFERVKEILKYEDEAIKERKRLLQEMTPWERRNFYEEPLTALWKTVQQCNQKTLDDQAMECKKAQFDYTKLVQEIAPEVLVTSKEKINKTLAALSSKNSVIHEKRIQELTELQNNIDQKIEQFIHPPESENADLSILNIVNNPLSFITDQIYLVGKILIVNNIKNSIEERHIKNMTERLCTLEEEKKETQQ